MQDELQFARKMTDHAKIEAAETVNKLTKSLEQSQRQCREILEEGLFRVWIIVVFFALLVVMNKFA